MKINISKTLRGSILDIGGGGEGIIGQVYQGQVTAIDNRQDELDEAPTGFKKVLMDASQMTFDNESFDNVTAFYSLMYMEKTIQVDAIMEAARVLRTNGELHIWDAEIESAYPNPYVTDLDIDANGKHVHTSYGIIKDDAKQNAEFFVDICKKAKLHILECKKTDKHFYIRLEK